MHQHSSRGILAERRIFEIHTLAGTIGLANRARRLSGCTLRVSGRGVLVSICWPCGPNGFQDRANRRVGYPSVFAVRFELTL